ncbi:MAG TPA: hypothetical protein VEA59_05985 [Patescibacteria group bacterium]|nr:hypothetical protein [Patescibacteria group bacterium]
MKKLLIGVAVIVVMAIIYFAGWVVLITKEVVEKLPHSMETVAINSASRNGLGAPEGLQADCGPASLRAKCKVTRKDCKSKDCPSREVVVVCLVTGNLKHRQQSSGTGYHLVCDKK